MQFEQALYSVAEGDQLSVCVELVLPGGTDTLDSEITVPIYATSGPHTGSYFNKFVSPLHYYWCAKEHRSLIGCVAKKTFCVPKVHNHAGPLWIQHVQHILLPEEKYKNE